MTSGVEPQLPIRRVHFPVTALGPGRRPGAWLQGCPLACAGCMSLDTWDPAGGVAVEVEQLAAAWHVAVEAGADGITISGGEPLVQVNALTALLRRIRETRSTADREHDILLFTGFEFDELDDEQLTAARLADVVVTGRYRAGEPTDLIWRGSANQRMHLNTDLADRRYQPLLGLAPARPPIQVRPEPDGFWLIGSPGAARSRGCNARSATTGSSSRRRRGAGRRRARPSRVRELLGALHQVSSDCAIHSGMSGIVRFGMNRREEGSLTVRRTALWGLDIDLPQHTDPPIASNAFQRAPTTIRLPTASGR